MLPSVEYHVGHGPNPMGDNMIVHAAKWDTGFEPGFGKTAALLVSDNPDEKWDKESYPYLSFGPHQPDSPLQRADLAWLIGRSLDTAKMIVRGWEGA